MKKLIITLACLTLIITFFAVNDFKAEAGKGSVDLETGLVNWWTNDYRDVRNATAYEYYNNYEGKFRSIATSTLCGRTNESNYASQQCFFRPGLINGAYLFTGTPMMFASTAPMNGALDFGTGNFTVAFWIKTHTTTAQAIVDRLDGHGVGSTKDDDYWAFVVNANGTLTFRLFDLGAAANYNATTAGAYNNEQWHLVVGQRTSTTQTQINIDGNKEIVVLNDANIANVNTSIVKGQLNFGGFFYNPSFAISTYTGLLDDVKIWNRALSAEEVSLLYRQGFSRSASDF